MATSPPPLIVGAGPTGLAAALFLAERGVRVRVIDAAVTPTNTSKALGVNPRTLALLEPTGVTARIVSEGMAMRRFTFEQRGRPLVSFDLDFAAMGAAYPMTILPQARTEALLTEALGARGVSVERGVALTGLTQDDTEVTCSLSLADGGAERLVAPMVLGADGAHSRVRDALGLGFPGSAQPEDWSLIDVELEGPDPFNGPWGDFQTEGPIIALPFDAKVWRLIGFGGDLLARLPHDWRAGEVKWRSRFHVSHRMVETMTVGRVCLAGDAAHIHSPIGARGMNLGIEDAYVFAACAVDALAGDPARLEAYGRIRRTVDAAVVKRIETLTNAVRARSGWVAMARSLVMPLVGRVPAIRYAVARQVTGLDHPVVTA